jgi:Membrane-associated sensor domain
MKKELPLSSRNIVMLLFVVAGLYMGSLHSFLLFHNLVELFTIAVAAAIFMLAWNARGIMQNNYLLFLGISYFFVGFLGLFHILSYKGMGIFQGAESNMAMQFWVGARYIEACSLFAAPMFCSRKIRPTWTIIFFSLLTSAFAWMIFSGVFPTCYVEGQGISNFKKVSEYIMLLILLGSLGMIYTRRHLFNGNLFILITAAILFTTIAAYLGRLLFSAICSDLFPSI